MKEILTGIILMIAVAGCVGQSQSIVIGAGEGEYLYVSSDNYVLTDSAGVAGLLYRDVASRVRRIEDSLQFRQARIAYEDFTGMGFFNVRQDSITDQLAGDWEIERTTDSTLFSAVIDSSGVIVAAADTGQIQVMTFKAIRVDDLPISPIYLSRQEDLTYESFSGKWIMRRDD